MRACSTCEWFVQSERPSEPGNCRRFPPTVSIFMRESKAGLVGSTVTFDRMAVPAWPPVSPVQWCGEWRDAADGRKVS